MSQNDETAGILKQWIEETSADSTALKRKRLDRKTNHQGLMKAETRYQGRQDHHLGETSCESRVSLWMRMRRTQTETKDPMRCFDRGESMLWLSPSYLGAQGCKPRRCDDIYGQFQQSERIDRSFETKAHSEESMNVSDMTVTDEDDFLSQKHDDQSKQQERENVTACGHKH